MRLTYEGWQRDLQQPLALGSFRNWLKLLHDNGGVDPVYRHRAAFVTLVSLFLTPLRLYERVKYAGSIKSTPIQESPIFILGHWRSGTTHLHRLMSQDETFGCISMFQAVAPEIGIVGERLIKPFMDRIMPPKRAMDNMTQSMDSPLEDEWAIANVSPYSFYHYWSFPRTARQYFEKYVLFQDAPEYAVAQWKEAYRTMVQKATFRTGGKRLLLKNPVNTGRVARLLDLFPNARFIHIYRNPYAVFASTLFFYKRMLSLIHLQEVNPEEIESDVLRFYEAMMKKFSADKTLIPAGNLVEVRFEDLDDHPLGEIKRIYDTLGLRGFEAAEPHFRAYVESQTNYQKNRFPADEEIIRKVDRHWHFAVEAWGYRPQ